MQKPLEIKMRFFESPKVVIFITVVMMACSVFPSLYINGVITSWDAVGHLLRAHYWIHHLVSTRFLGGWFPHWNGGFDLYDTAPPLFTFIIGLQQLILPPQLVLRLMMLLLLISIVPVSYLVLRRFGASPLAAAVGASMTAFLDAEQTFGVDAIYGSGLLPNALGFLLALLSISQVKKDIEEENRSFAQCLISAVLLALTIIAHPVMSYWALVAFGVIAVSNLVVTRGRLRAVAARSCFILVVAAVLSMIWWVPLLLNFKTMYRFGPFGDHTAQQLLTRFFFLTDADPTMLLPVSIAGIFGLASRENKSAAIQWIAMMAVTAALAFNWINSLMPFASVMGSTQRARFEGFFIWFMLASIAFAVDFILSLIKTYATPAKARIIWMILMVSFFAFVLVPYLMGHWARTYVVRNAATEDLPEIRKFLTDHLRAGDFVITEYNEDCGFYGTPHFLTQHLPMTMDNFWDISGNFPEGNLSAIASTGLARRLPMLGPAQFRYMNDRGVRFILTTSRKTAHKLEENEALTRVWPDQRDSTWSLDRVSIFELKDSRRRFGLPVDASEKLADIRFEPRGVYHLAFSSPVSLPALASLAISFHPWMTVRANGAAVRTFIGKNFSLGLRDALTDVRELEISFNPPSVVRFAQVTSLLGWLIVAVFLWRSSR